MLIPFGELLDPSPIPKRWKRMFLVGVACNGAKIKVNSESGAVANQKLAMVSGIPAADQFVAPLRVVFGKVLLNDDVRRRPIEVNGGTQSDGADRGVRREEHVPRLRQRGDLFADMQ